MISVSEFNSAQKQDFKRIISDFGGPTSTAYVLSVLERAVHSLGQPNIDPSCFGEDVELHNEFDVCMAALEYSRMLDIE